MVVQWMQLAEEPYKSQLRGHFIQSRGQMLLEDIPEAQGGSGSDEADLVVLPFRYWITAELHAIHHIPHAVSSPARCRVALRLPCFVEEA